MAALVGVANLRAWQYKRRKLRVPVAEKLLRAPGESLRRKLEALEEDISAEVAVGFVLPPLYVGSILVQKGKIPLESVHIGIYAAIGLVTFVWLIFPQRRGHVGVRG